jgi:NAD-dependent deacetylase
MEEVYLKAAQVLKYSDYVVAHTGAGISVESGVPPFRGEGGLWNKYDPSTLELGFFLSRPDESWAVIREVFYNFFGKVHPNSAHKVLAKWEQQNQLKAVITQNIDDLHQMAGSHEVYEFHGNAKRLICVVCETISNIENLNLDVLPPYCTNCMGLLKPDFIFFGEGIPPLAYSKSVEAARLCNAMLIIGTAGEVSPANQIPIIAKEKGATIIEINLEPSLYTKRITDIFIQGKAGEVLPKLDRLLNP